MKNDIIKTELINWKEIELFQPKDLKKMSTLQFEKLKTSLKNNGFKTPFYVWQDEDKTWCLDGHMRIPVMKVLESEGETIPEKLPANFINCKDKKEAKKAVMIYNSHYSDILQENLNEWVKDLNLEELTAEIDIDGIEFDFQIEETKNDNEVPEDVKPVTKSGDLWELGNHRVLCGDSTKVEDVERLMGGNKADMVFTDPPYGVSIGDKNKLINTFLKDGRCTENIKNDTMSPGDLKIMLTSAFSNLKRVSNDCCSYFITAPQRGELCMMMMMMMKESGLPIKHIIIWVKNQKAFSFGRMDYEYKHEPILYTWNKKHKFYAKGKQKSTVWEFDRERKCDVHPTMKPVELVENAVMNNSLDGMNIVDLFLGSGSTLIACEKTNRICYGMELDEHYCDVIVNRYNNWCNDNNAAPEIKLNGEPYKIGDK
jgi:DNA modification methylase